MCGGVCIHIKMSCWSAGPFICLIWWNAAYSIFKLFDLFIYIYLVLRDRERQSISRGGTERERKTQNLKQASGSELSAQSLT